MKAKELIELLQEDPEAEILCKMRIDTGDHVQTYLCIPEQAYVSGMISDETGEVTNFFILTNLPEEN